MVRTANRVVFHTSGSFTENKMSRDALWLRVRDGVFLVDMMAAPPGREQNSKSTLWEARHVARLKTVNGLHGRRGM